MTYITIYNPDVNPGRPRAVDLVRHRTPDHETDFAFDLRWHFRKRHLDEEAYEAHLRAAAPHGYDALAVEFTLLLLTTLHPGWDLDDRTCSWRYGLEGERTALLAHAIEHPHDWDTVGGGLVLDPDRNRLERVQLRHRGGRLVIVALDADRGLAGEDVPLRDLAWRLSPTDLTSTLFSMLPAIAEHMTDEPDLDVWDSEEAYAAAVDLAHIPDDAPHRKTLRPWKAGAEGTIDAAVKNANWCACRRTTGAAACHGHAA